MPLDLTPVPHDEYMGLCRAGWRTWVVAELATYMQEERLHDTHIKGFSNNLLELINKLGYRVIKMKVLFVQMVVGTYTRPHIVYKLKHISHNA